MLDGTKALGRVGMSGWTLETVKGAVEAWLW